ncbi:hypothetical protein [Absidia glauca]|uniref:Uncharacterized protein n=1 Tax=Absidia glauca TaxID=4829 RepID=A0A168RWS2_ABSGL|nr:hypothetical protein [Absidia glauca]
MHERKTSRASTLRTNPTKAKNTTANTTATRTSITGTKKPPIPPSPSRRGTQQRSDRASITSVTNQKKLTDEQKETQRRIAARAATAMAQVRKRQPRSYMCWGDNRRAVIKRYPDGTQEILVPQTLTPEQEQYEFPPRSRLLKKLANSTAERQRLSSLQHTITAPNVSPTLPAPLSTPQQLGQHIPASPLTNHSTISTLVITPGLSHPSTSAQEPDQTALDEWFSGHQRHTHQNKRSKKEKAVMEWVSDVKRSTSLLKKSSARSSVINTTTNNLSSSSKRSSLSSVSKSSKRPMHNVDLNFKSDAGKRWTSGELFQKTNDHLSPPKEGTKKHYVRRQRLLQHGNKPWVSPSPAPEPTPITMPFYHTDRHGNNNKRNDSMYELLLAKSTTTAVPPSSDRHLLYSPSRVPRSTVSASPTTKTGMVQLVQMFHKTLQDQQARAHERMQQLESLLEEERSKRHDIQRTQQVTMSRLDTFMKKYQEQRTPPSPTLSAATSSPPTSPSLASHCNSTRQQQQRQQPFDEWMERINRLETSVENESQSRHRLQQSVVDTVERLDALKRSVSRQAHEHSTSRRHLEQQINQALTNLSILTQQNQQRKR